MAQQLSTSKMTNSIPYSNIRLLSVVYPVDIFSSSCADCVSDGYQSLSNDTLHFLDILNQTISCFEKYKQVWRLCVDISRLDLFIYEINSWRLSFTLPCRETWQSCAPTVKAYTRAWMTCTAKRSRIKLCAST